MGERGYIVEKKTKHPLYHLWRDIHARCYNPKKQNYKWYGGRGIEVHQRWHSFEKFVVDIGPKPSAKHSLERIDNNGNYDWRNCRWATQTEQMNNTRATRFVVISGERISLTEASARYGIPSGTLWKRLNDGWGDAQAVLTPIGPSAERRKEISRNALAARYGKKSHV